MAFQLSRGEMMVALKIAVTDGSRKAIGDELMKLPLNKIDHWTAEAEVAAIVLREEHIKSLDDFDALPPEKYNSVLNRIDEAVMRMRKEGFKI